MKLIAFGSSHWHSWIYRCDVKLVVYPHSLVVYPHSLLGMWVECITGADYYFLQIQRARGSALSPLGVDCGTSNRAWLAPSTCPLVSPSTFQDYIQGLGAEARRSHKQAASCSKKLRLGWIRRRASNGRRRGRSYLKVAARRCHRWSFYSWSKL